MLQNALEGCGGAAAASAYTDAFRIIMRIGIVDKSSIVRVAAARCLKAFANIGGPGLGVGELDNASSSCVKVDELLSSFDFPILTWMLILILLEINTESLTLCFAGP